MDIKHLKTFSTIAALGSFSHASRELGYAQPTVSTHVQLLEKEFNIKLFERLGHRIKLTREGERFLIYAENIVRLSDEASAMMSELSSSETVAGKITIGANESFSVVRLPSVLKHFMQSYPQVDINLKFGSIKEIHEQLQNNTVDVAFFLTREVDYADLKVETLLIEPVVMVASPDHLLSPGGLNSLRMLENQELIITQENCTFRALINDLLNKARVKPRSIIEINNLQAIKQLVMSGLGITILPRITVEYEISQRLLIELPWNNPPLPVATQVAYHKDKWLSPPILGFLEHTRRYYS